MEWARLSKKTIAIAFVVFIMTVQFIPVTIAAGNTKMGISNTSQATVGSTFTATVWLNGDESIDAFKINQMDWNATIIQASSAVNSGWWDWLWDDGEIDNEIGRLTGVQAGEQTGTTANRTACTLSFTASTVGTATLALSDVQTSSGGPTVPCATFNSSVTVHPARGTLSATAYNPNQINLTFTSGDGGSYTVIRGSMASQPTDPTEGSEIYNGTGTSYEHDGLNGDDTWYYTAWTYNNTEKVYSLSYRTQTVTTPVTKMGFDPSNVCLNTNQQLSVWLNGAEAIDGFKIEYLNFSAEKITVNSLEAGWWDWLWDEGTTDNIAGTIEDIQGAEQSGTLDNQTALNISFSADEVGTCTVTLSQTKVSSSGPLVDCISYDNSFTIHPEAASITASADGTDTINLDFAPGTGADQTVVRGSTSSYPSSPTSGTLIYSGIDTSTSHTGLDPEQQWYYTAFSYNTTESLYSLTGDQATATTMTDNRPPEIGTPSPANGSTGQSTSFTWVLPISDPDGDVFDYAMECSNGQTKSATGEENGTKFFSLSSLEVATEYTIWVNVTDGTNSTSEWFTFTTQTNASGGTGGGIQVINIMVPNDATVEYEDIRFLIKLINPDTGNPKTGSRLDIDVNIAYINGTSIVSEDHPDELGNGLYMYEIDYNIGIDDFVAWATYEYDGTEYMDAEIFKIKWDVYNNVSRLTERVGDVIYLFRYENQNQTRMISYKINQIQNSINEIDVEMEEQTLGQRLTDIAIDSVLRIIVMTSIITIILLIGGLIWGQRKTRRLVRTATVPANAAQKIVFGNEPVYSRPTRNIGRSQPSRPPESRPVEG